MSKQEAKDPENLRVGLFKRDVALFSPAWRALLGSLSLSRDYARRQGVQLGGWIFQCLFRTRGVCLL